MACPPQGPSRRPTRTQGPAHRDPQGFPEPTPAPESWAPLPPLKGAVRPPGLPSPHVRGEHADPAVRGWDPSCWAHEAELGRPRLPCSLQVLVSLPLWRPGLAEAPAVFGFLDRSTKWAAGAQGGLHGGLRGGTVLMGQVGSATLGVSKPHVQSRAAERMGGSGGTLAYRGRLGLHRNGGPEGQRPSVGWRPQGVCLGPQRGLRTTRAREDSHRLLRGPALKTPPEASLQGQRKHRRLDLGPPAPNSGRAACISHWKAGPPWPGPTGSGRAPPRSAHLSSWVAGGGRPPGGVRRG